LQRVKKIKEISPSQKEILSAELLQLSQQFDYVSILDSNDYPDKYGKYELLAAFGAHRLLKSNYSSFDELRSFHSEKETWLFGHLSYELKDQLEILASEHPNNFDFDLLSFFEPLHLLVWKRGESVATWFSHNGEALESLLDQIDSYQLQESLALPLNAQLSKAAYLDKVKALKDQIRYGNIYEINFCQTFSGKTTLDPASFYHQLGRRSPMPFSAFYKQGSNYLLSASPERFICKRGKKLICQPIKGTAKRSEDPNEDLQISKALGSDLKEQTENVMIVDLMRNDLSRTAAVGSVEVEELFGIYSFPQVHQLISTVTSTLAEEYNAIKAIEMAFPMGSMTGAPKIKAMELIETFEDHRRELYSGSVGYFDPEGDFDFNVVIRSLLYSAEKEFASLTVGGAITDLAIAEQEYQECLLKAKAIFEPTDPDPEPDVKSPR